LLKLRRVEILGFKSFCEKTQVTFSGTGLTCIVGPNGCGKSNIVDAISWVLGEQSTKSLRAERMADCIFSGTAKRPPMGLAEVIITLEDTELAEAGRFILTGQMGEATSDSASAAGQEASVTPEAGTVAVAAENGAAVDGSNGQETGGADEFAPDRVEDGGERSSPAAAIEMESNVSEITAEPAPEGDNSFIGKKKRAAKPAVNMKPGQVVIGRRLYRSGQSEYLINGRTARLRDVQEIFMGVGLGPDSYAIIEQGRIGQILSSKPADRRAIIEEAAGITK
jgi:chromosome segregation protein